MKKRKKKAARAAKPVRVRKKAAPRTRKPDHIDAFIDSSVATLGLKIKDAWRPSIRSNLQVTLQHAARVMQFPLPDESEPGPIFRA